jgi:radical SAM superfamily enzyme YgiQ (UPF0313 family)
MNVPVRRPVRLLLINPRFPESFWSFRWALGKILPGKRALNPPLGLATLAALCPLEWEVHIVDENVEPVPLDPQADIVGVCGMAVQFERQRELLAYYRRRGFYTLAGGSFASLCPERFAGTVDTVVAGEAEYIWPQFCCDFERGAPAAEYHETGTVNLEDSPPPRFDLLALERYTSVSMQFSRGCPFRCDFCDIIVMFGRQPRTKSVEQIGRELDALRTQGVRSVFFVDDNLIGNKKLAKQLLRYLIDYQTRHGYAFRFGTEASINLADDKEMLGLARAANFGWVFIGIESSDAATLKETNKTQNTKGDLLEAIRTIYAHGIDVLAGFIVGFDNDTLATFEQQHRFISRSGVQVAMVGLLTALPRTPLYERLKREGRLLPESAHGDNTKLGTNFLPKRMSYDAMVQNYQRLYRRLFSDRGIARRILNKTRHLGAAAAAEYSWREQLGIVRRLWSRGVLAGGPRRMLYFLYTLMRSRLRAWPQVMLDWIVGLAMRDYVRRHFVGERAAERRAVRRATSALRRFGIADLHRGALEIMQSLESRGVNVHIRLRGGLDGDFFRSAGRRLERMLRRSRATLTFSVEALHAGEQRHFERLLACLAPYGDRVSVWVGEHLRPLVAVDSSVFRVVLGERVSFPHEQGAR